MSLRRVVCNRLLVFLPILCGVSVITFAVVYLTPGDPISRLVAANPNVSPGEKAQLRAQYGLDGPLWAQYVNWIGNVLTGDFGEVYGSNRSVSTVILARLPETVALGVLSWVFALAVAIPTGIYAAVRKDGPGDTASRLVALSGVSIPNFWLGLVLILVFALWLDLWQVTPPRQPVYHPETLWYLVLPAVTIGTAAAASLMRVLRTSMVEELNSEYVTAARAKGLPERTIVYKHALRNASCAVVTIAASLTAGIIGGSVVVEVVFAWPGLGRELIQAINSHEIHLITTITLCIGVVVSVANLIADVLYAVLDPRVRYE